MSLQLETFPADKIPELLKWIDSPELHQRWTGKFFRYPLETQQIALYLDQARQPHAQHKPFAIQHTDLGLVGYAELSHIWPHLSARISRLLIGPAELRGKGFGLAATKLLLQEAFGPLHVHRVDLGVLQDNQVAIRTYQKAGFRQVGLWSDFPGSPQKLVWMSLDSSTYQSS